MVYILGVPIKDERPVKYALLGFYGIGRAVAEKICARLSFHDTLKVKELTDGQLTSLSQLLSNMTIEGDLKRQRDANISRFYTIRSYRGLRHAAGLPVHGQNTRTNAKTAKKLNRLQRRTYSTNPIGTLGWNRVLPTAVSILQKIKNIH
ncbi:ribosomal protein subunit S37 [Schizosaccharomyces octosporus yFS286]|uniref:Small ribosomal subunit protein uS13m n=1 Tax=Schizosaccharomyces octosporus (strain yFS286) TaxID=483514 RepID=S9PSC6_SCHOY|nr:ribosomal protein subunit S37 [Schizosaccharomyces octosporus yFS286]EPX70892.1 ribosomal protein subunit S37 [Schizosaccharomyces octosporus yFS286]